jgi:hypothetical protein
MSVMRILRLAVLYSVAVLLPVGCQSAYYTTLEKLGYHKRDILVSRVQDARDSQQEAKEQFASALDKFTSVVQVQGGELQDKYNQLKAEFDQSEAHAETVRQRIRAVEDVAEALFDEWQAELAQYSNARLRRASARQLAQTRQHYEPLIGAMKRAEAKIEPVLAVFQDQVLFLKHNLNAQAIASLQQELVSVETDVAALVRDMEASIAEADAFLKTMEAPPPSPS